MKLGPLYPNELANAYRYSDLDLEPKIVFTRAPWQRFCRRIRIRLAAWWLRGYPLKESAWRWRHWREAEYRTERQGRWDREDD